MHPAFNSPGARRQIEIGQNHRTGRQEVLRSINVKRYLDIPSAKGEAIPGQPAVQVSQSRNLVYALVSLAFHIKSALLQPTHLRAVYSILQGWIGSRWTRRTSLPRNTEYVSQETGRILPGLPSDTADTSVSIPEGSISPALVALSNDVSEFG